MREGKIETSQRTFPLQLQTAFEMNSKRPKNDFSLPEELAVVD
jgi:hypothetical protein